MNINFSAIEIFLFTIVSFLVHFIIEDDDHRYVKQLLPHFSGF